MAPWLKKASLNWKLQTAARQNSFNSAKNAVKAVGMTLSEGFLVTNLIH